MKSRLWFVFIATCLAFSEESLAYPNVEIINDTDYQFSGKVTFAGCPSSDVVINPRTVLKRTGNYGFQNLFLKNLPTNRDYNSILGSNFYIPEFSSNINVSANKDVYTVRQIWKDQSRGFLGWCLVTGISGNLFDINGINKGGARIENKDVIPYDSFGTSFSEFRVTQWGKKYRVFSTREILLENKTAAGMSPGFWFWNKTQWPVAYSINQVGCLYHDVLLPGKTRAVDTGAVWFTLNFQITPDQTDLVSDSDCVKDVAVFSTKLIAGTLLAFASGGVLAGVTAAGGEVISSVAEHALSGNAQQIGEGIANIFNSATGVVGAISLEEGITSIFKDISKTQIDAFLTTMRGDNASQEIQQQRLADFLQQNMQAGLSWGDGTTGIGGVGFGKVEMKSQYAGPPWPVRCKYMPSYVIEGGPEWRKVNSSYRFVNNPLKVRKINGCGNSMMAGASLQADSSEFYERPRFDSEYSLGRIGWFARINCSHEDLPDGNKAHNVNVVWWSSDLKLGESNFNPSRTCASDFVGTEYNSLPIVRMTKEVYDKVVERDSKLFPNGGQLGLTHFTIENRTTDLFYIDDIEIFQFNQNSRTPDSGQECKYIGPYPGEKVDQSLAWIGGTDPCYMFVHKDAIQGHTKFSSKNGEVFCLNASGNFPQYADQVRQFATTGGPGKIPLCPAQWKFDIRTGAVSVGEAQGESYKEAVAALNRRVARSQFMKGSDFQKKFLSNINVLTPLSKELEHKYNRKLFYYIEYDSGVFYRDIETNQWSGWDDWTSESNHHDNWEEVPTSNAAYSWQLTLKNKITLQVVTINFSDMKDRGKLITWQNSARSPAKIQKLGIKQNPLNPPTITFAVQHRDDLVPSPWGPSNGIPVDAFDPKKARFTNQPHASIDSCYLAAINIGAPYFTWIEKSANALLRCLLYIPDVKHSFGGGDPQQWRKVSGDQTAETYRTRI